MGGIVGGVDEVERRRRAWVLRSRGVSDGAVAAELGYANGRVVAADLEGFGGGGVDRDWLRGQVGARLERVSGVLLGKALDADCVEQVSASHALVRVLGAFSKLYGLDAPERSVVWSPSHEELVSWVDSVVEGSGSGGGGLPVEGVPSGEVGPGVGGSGG